MKEKYIRTTYDIHHNNKVLKLTKSTSRVFVISVDRKTKIGYEGSCEFVKNSRIYNPFFDVKDFRNYEEYGKKLEELIAEGFNLKYEGYHGDGKDAFWNNANELDLIVMSRLLN